MNILRLKDLIVELEIMGNNNAFNDKVIIEKDKIILLDNEGNEKDCFEVLHI